MKNIPRCWPILYSLYKLDKIEGNFYLQKYIYLAKVEGEIPIEYEFTKDDYGPYTSSIKSDAFLLKEEGYIEMEDVGKWIFKITNKGKQIIKNLLKSISKRHIKHFNAVLDKYSSYTFYQLKNYVYNHHIKEEGEYEKLKTQMLIDIKDVISIFRSKESSRNSIFIRGSLDYCLTVLKNENLKDPIQKDMLLNYISSYVDYLLEVNDLILNEPDTLTNLSIVEGEEKFDYIQEICSKELKIFPRLDDESLDLELLLDDDDEKLSNPLFTSPVRC